MNRIPANLDLNEIIGSYIDRLCLGKYDVALSFSSGTQISIQSRIEIIEYDRVIAEWNEKNGWSNNSFYRIFNHEVQYFLVASDRLIEIKLSNGISLYLHDNSDQYESMQIYLKDSDAPIVI